MPALGGDKMAAAVPIISVVLAVASTATTAYSQYRAGREEKKAGKRAAAQRIREAEQRREIERKRHQRIIATQKARYGAAGLTMEGSPLLVQMESMRESEEELARIMETGYAQARILRRGGKAAQTAGYLGAGATALEGVGTLGRIGRQYDWW